MNASRRGFLKTSAAGAAGLVIGCGNAWHWVVKEDKAMRDEQNGGAGGENDE